MNKDMKKSLRQAMLSTAAALVSIGFMACSDDTFMTQHSTTAPVNGYKISIPANMGAAGTRAIAYNSETGGYDATFEMNDKIYIYNETKDAEGMTIYDWGTSTAYLQPSSNGKNSNLVGQLSFAKWDENAHADIQVVPEVGDKIMLFYKEPYFDYSRDFSHQEEADYAMAVVEISSVKDGNILTSEAFFENLQSVYEINFEGIASDVMIKKVTIESEQQKLVDYYIPTDREWFNSVIYTYKDNGTDQHKLLFLLRFDVPNYGNNSDTENTSGDVITFRVLGSDGRYYVGRKTVTKDLENGKYYSADLAMTDAGLAVTLTNNTTGELVELAYRSATLIHSKKAAYTVANVGYNTEFSWYGGENPLTLKNLTLYNKLGGISASTDYNDVENTKMHHLILDGVNTIYGSTWTNVLSVENNSSLVISALSGGKLNIERGEISVTENCTMTIESGEITTNERTIIDKNAILKVEGGSLTTNALASWHETSKCIISKDGQVRISSDSDVREGLIKAAAGYVLNVSTEGNYTVYTVTEAPAPKDLSAVTTADLGSVIGSDGKVYVPNCGLPEGVDPVGMIANISSTGHGLAIAMDRVKIRNGNEYDWYDANSFTWNNAGEYNDGKTATEIFNDWKASNSVSFGTWRFATAADWQQMVLSCRIDGDATEASEEMVAEGLVTQLKKVGIYQGYLECWTGEPGEIEGLWTSIYFDNGYWDEVSQSYQPKQLVIQRWKDPGDNYLAIHPVLEF